MPWPNAEHLITLVAHDETALLDEKFESWQVKTLPKTNHSALKIWPSQKEIHLPNHQFWVEISKLRVYPTTVLPFLMLTIGKKAPNERNCWKIWGSWDHHGHHMVVSCSIWGLLACTLHLDSATVIPMFDVKFSMYTMASKQLKSPTIPTMKPINFGYLHCICTVSYIARLYPYSTQWHFISPRIVDGNRKNKTNPI